MGMPTFRFIDADGTTGVADVEFWRDVEASDRLGSPLKANLYLRELCRTKAGRDSRRTLDPRSLQEGEKALLHEVYARGYRLFGPDLDAPVGGSLSHAGVGAA